MVGCLHFPAVNVCLSVRATHAARLPGVSSSLPSMSVDHISEGSFFCMRELPVLPQVFIQLSLFGFVVMVLYI